MEVGLGGAIVYLEHLRVRATLCFYRQGEVYFYVTGNRYSVTQKDSAGRNVMSRKTDFYDHVVRLQTGMVYTPKEEVQPKRETDPLLTTLIARLVDHQVSGEKLLQGLALRIGKWKGKLRENFMGGWNLYRDDEFIKVDRLVEWAINERRIGGAQSSQT